MIQWSMASKHKLTFWQISFRKLYWKSRIVFWKRTGKQFKELILFKKDFHCIAVSLFKKNWQSSTRMKLNFWEKRWKKWEKTPLKEKNSFFNYFLKTNKNTKEKGLNGENKEKDIFIIQDLPKKVVGIAISKDI